MSWYREIASSVDSSGLKAANKFTIRIPDNADFSGKAYADPIAYASDDPADVFTLKSGDIIVKGAANDVSPRPTELRSSYPDVVTILGVTDNRRAPRSPHFKVVGA